MSFVPLSEALTGFIKRALFEVSVKLTNPGSVVNEFYTAETVAGKYETIDGRLYVVDEQRITL